MLTLKGLKHQLFNLFGAENLKGRHVACVTFNCAGFVHICEEGEQCTLDLELNNGVVRTIYFDLTPDDSTLLADIEEAQEDEERSIMERVRRWLRAH